MKSDRLSIAVLNPVHNYGDIKIMQDAGEMLVQMWLSLKPYIDKKERSDAALAFLRSCEDFLSLETAREEASEADSALLGAFNEILGEEETDEPEEGEEY